MNNLFIYIPTYNRPVSLQRQLSVLLPQVKKYPDNVRVLICDNNSEEYEEKDILKNHPHLNNVEVRRNVGNIHGNANISLGFVFAQANEFLWILSDDDLITNDAVQEVLSRLDNNIDILVFSISDRVSIMTLNWNTDDLLLPMKLGSGLISNIVYRIDSVKYSIYEAFYYHNSSFPHLAVQLSAWKKNKEISLLILPRKLVLVENQDIKKENIGDYSLSNVTMPLLSPLLSEKFSNIFLKDWIKRHGVKFFSKKNTYPHLYIQSKSTINYYGSMNTVIQLKVQYILFLIFKIFNKLFGKENINKIIKLYYKYIDS